MRSFKMIAPLMGAALLAGCGVSSQPDFEHEGSMGGNDNGANMVIVIILSAALAGALLQRIIRARHGARRILN